MGPKLEDFEVLGTIGSGSHGTVRKLRRRQDGQILVWKELNYGAMTEAEKQGLVMEVNLLRELRHPNIVRFQHHIVDRRATTLYILMEYCPGGDLGRLVARCRQTSTFLEEGFIWRVLSQICQALKVCHDRCLRGGRLVLHRDIKPANVFLDAEGRVKLGDFGLARTLNSEASFATTFAGTPYYMSPEVMQGRDYNERSDMWSLGCLVYELCALRPPFQASTHKDLAAKIREARFDSIPIQYSCQLKEVLALLLTYEDFLRPTALTVLHHSSVVANTLGPVMKEREEEDESGEDALSRSLDDSVLFKKYGNIQNSGNVENNEVVERDRMADQEEKLEREISGEVRDVENGKELECSEEEDGQGNERGDQYGPEVNEDQVRQDSLGDLPVRDDNAKEDDDWSVKFKQEFTKGPKVKVRESQNINVSPMTETYSLAKREEGRGGKLNHQKPTVARHKADTENWMDNVAQESRPRVYQNSSEVCMGETMERICQAAKVREVREPAPEKLECACGGMSSNSWRERMLALREAEVVVREREVAVKEREREVREREHRVTAMEREARQHLVRAQIYLRQSRPRQNAATSPHRPASDLDTTVSADPGDEQVRTTARPDPQRINNPFLEMRGVPPQPEKHVSFRTGPTKFKSNTLDNPKSRWKRGNIFGLVDRTAEGKKEAKDKISDEAKDKAAAVPSAPLSDNMQRPNPAKPPPPNTSDHPRLNRRQGSVETLLRRRNSSDDKENQVQGVRRRNMPDLKLGPLGGPRVGQKMGRQSRERGPTVKPRAQVLQFYNVV